ncbi:hypothetical protein pkur_cds_661 [Pandoravirus kuranda]|uniref:DUF5867 domain-containing protein n=1 Tax=Pandoravirus kuranda TaxID=3019033 RepID=A0AA95J6U4_9VIRU|nr:hypothetical protein pkur_cds_661 [Pandoravirus kuranda]
MHSVESHTRSPSRRQDATPPTTDSLTTRPDNTECHATAAFYQAAAHCTGLPDPPSLSDGIKEAFDVALAQITSTHANEDGGVVVCDGCFALEALARSYGHMAEETLADTSLESISVWLLCAVCAHACAKECPIERARVLRERGDDGPCADLTLCRSADTYALVDGDGGKLCARPALGCSTGLPCNHTERMVGAIKAFVTCLLRADIGRSHVDYMVVCRGPACLLGRALRRKVVGAHTSQTPAPNLSGVALARSAIARNMSTADAHEAVAYMLGLLTSIDASSVDIRDQTCDPALQEAAAILGDPSHPLRSVFLKGLGIMGTDIEDTDHDIGRDDGAPSIDGAIHPQDDLVTRAYEHEPDLFVDILSHADPKAICALARTSRSHYVLIARTLRDDDARGDARLLKRVALSGTVWLQDYSESGMYDPRAYVISPALPDQQALPSLRAITSTCKLVARIEMPREEVRDLILSMGKLAAACALGCGGAVARYLSAIKCDLDPGTAGKRRLADHYTRIARCAGMYASPMLMRIAITAMVRTVAERRARRCRFMPSHQSEVQSLVISAVSGIVRGFALPSTRRRSLPDLPALVDVLCAFLAAVRRDMDAHGFAGEYIFARLRGSFCRAALVVLAPGTSLPMPSARIRLASALFEAARPEPPS